MNFEVMFQVVDVVQFEQVSARRVNLLSFISIKFVMLMKVEDLLILILGWELNLYMNYNIALLIWE